MIVLLTYERPHRKTQDILYELRMHGFDHVHVLAFPWVTRKPRNPLLPHRPGDPGFCMTARDLPTLLICNQFGYTYAVVPKDEMARAINDLSPSVVVVGGSGILSAEIVKTHTVLNIHPGILPDYRGLDAMKWAILEGGKIGCTAHVCDERADAGTIVFCEYLKPRPDESFDAFAVRHYEKEISMFVPAIIAIKADIGNDKPLPEDLPSPVRKRMPLETEEQLDLLKCVSS